MGEMAARAGDPEKFIGPWARQGVPLGIEMPIVAHGILPKTEEKRGDQAAPDMQEAFMSGFKNYLSLYDDKKGAKKEVERYLAVGCGIEVYLDVPLWLLAGTRRQRRESLALLSLTACDLGLGVAWYEGEHVHEASRLGSVGKTSSCFSRCLRRWSRKSTTTWCTSSRSRGWACEGRGRLRAVSVGSPRRAAVALGSLHGLRGGHGG